MQITAKQEHTESQTATKMSIQQVQEKYNDSLMSLPGVEGTGIGRKGKKDCIVVFVNKLTKELKKKIPSELEGYPVKIEVTGKFHAYPRR